MLAMMLALTLNAPIPARPVPPTVMEVDCDAGQSLSRALLRVRRAPGSTILIRGTCVGNFVLTTDSVQLRGFSPEESVLAAPAPEGGLPILEVRDARDVSIRRLGFRQGLGGVRFLRSPGGAVFESEFEGNGVGVVFSYSDDGHVWDTVFHDNDFGLVSQYRSSVNVQQSTFLDNRVEGLQAFSHSSLILVDSQVTGSGQAGVNASTVSDVLLWTSAMSDNGDAHLFADDRSKVQIVGGVSLGTAEDATPFAVLLDQSSSLHSGAEADYYGEILVWRNSFLELGNVNVHGPIRSEYFSRVMLFQTQLTEPAVCTTGADLTCSGNAGAETSDCPSAANCVAPSAPSARRDRPDRPAVDRVPEILRRARPPFRE